LFVDRDIDLGTVEQKKCCHRSVSPALVAVYKGMALGECVTQRGRRLDQGVVKVSSSEGGSRLGYDRFQGAEITNSMRTAGRG
jgi:hypothetical protein